MTAVSMPPEEALVTLAILPGAPENDVVPVVVSASPPAGTARIPVDICCVVDVSGSMNADAVLQTEAGSSAGHGLSVLDIVKHSMRTIIRNLEATDRLALVAYSTTATVVFGATEMNEEGRTQTEGLLNDLRADGMTNLWDGLKTGMELLKNVQGPGRLQHIMLFTDGLPNINPPRGILPMVKRMKDKEGGKLPCTISTFGFGYELDSELLSELAIAGSGTYAFIPDAGFVGTVFVNAMSNLLVTMAKDAVLTLTPMNRAGFAPGLVLGGHPVTKAGESAVVNLGSMAFGQSKDVVVNMTIPADVSSGDYLEAKLEYITRAGSEPASVSISGGGAGDDESHLLVGAQRCRVQFVDTVREAMKLVKQTSADKASGKPMPLPDAQALLVKLADEISASPSYSADDALKALLEDLQGQVCEAFSREDWYSKWGVHYLPSLLCAHLAQVCNNFKDPGVQGYGGEVFADLRDKADDIFCTLPAPTPAVRPIPVQSQRATYSAPTPAVAPAPVAMGAFYDRYCG